MGARARTAGDRSSHTGEIIRYDLYVHEMCVGEGLLCRTMVGSEVGEGSEAGEGGEGGEEED